MEDYDDDFVVDDNEDQVIIGQKKIKYTFIEEEQQQHTQQPANQKDITQYLGKQAQPKKKKQQQQTLIDFDDDEIDQMLDRKVQPTAQVTQIVVQPLSNKEELYKAQYDQPLQPIKRAREEYEQPVQQEKDNNTLDQQKSDSIDFDQLEQMMQQAKQTKPKAIPAPVVIPMAPKQQIKIEKPLELQQTQHVSTLNEQDVLSMNTTKNITDILEKNNSILFYWIDIFEDQYNYPGELMLFGKVLNHTTRKYESCSIYFPDFQKIIYLLPTNQNTSEDEMRVETALLMKKYLSLGEKDWSGRLVQKKYAFEIREVPTEPTTYFEITYPLKESKPFPMKPQSTIFQMALQTTISASEQFLIYNHIKGPSWLQIGKCKIPQDLKNLRVSTRYLLQISSTKDIQVAPQQQPAPPLRVLSLAVKGIISSNKTEELLAASIVLQDDVDPDGGATQKQNQGKVLFNSFIRMPNNQRWPGNYKSNMKVQQFDNEYSLIGAIINKIDLYDPDVIVGHDIYSRIFGLLNARILKTKVTTASKLARLQRGGGGASTKASQNARTRQLTIGRLVVDTFLAAKETVKSNDFTLEFLGKKFLNEKHIPLESDITSEYMEDGDLIETLIGLNEKEANITLKLMNKLQVIPLTKQLTNIGGNQWIRSLQNARAERNEMLLMHEFYKEGYLLPDTNKYFENNEDPNNKATYAGGKVIEPIPNIYTDFILLLDFNSLYPSIIMEYNICFTTVQRNQVTLQEFMNRQKGQQKNEDESYEGTVIPDSKEGLLPKIIANLINMRKLAKKKMQEASGIEKQVWDIRQLAVKLVANSIYGCLGFQGSRFYALGIASLITRNGRNILENSIEQVKQMGYDVIYGDTDSMMINPKLPNLAETIKTGYKIQRAINQNYKKLQLGLDGIFITLLLLKKKKYAATKVANLENVLANKEEVIEEREIKGIDLVRREFCDFSKFIQSKVLDILLGVKELDQILHDLCTLLNEMKSLFSFYSGEATESSEQEILESHRFLREPIKLSQFIITKQLNKAPHEYKDADHHPHVQVAKRMIDQGRTPQSLVNHFIHYIICHNPDQKQIPQRAFSPEEVRALNLQVDYNYYKSAQIFDPIERLCKNLDGITMEQLANAIGLDSNKYKQKNTTEQNEFTQMNVNRKEIKYLGPFKSICPHCTLEFSYAQLVNPTSPKGIVTYSQQCPNKDVRKKLKIQFYKCLKPFESNWLSNQIKLNIKRLSHSYYDGAIECKRNSSKQYGGFSHQLLCFGSCCEVHTKIRHLYSEDEANQSLRHLELLLASIHESKHQIKKPFLSIELQQLFAKLKL